MTALLVISQRWCAPLRQPMLQAQIIRGNRGGTFQADRTALSGAQIEEGIFHNDCHAIGAAFIDPFKMHATAEFFGRCVTSTMPSATSWIEQISSFGSGQSACC